MSRLIMKKETIGGLPHDVIVGKLLSFKVNLSVKMKRITDRKSMEAPHWDILAKAPHGEVVKVGAAKEHEITRGENMGKAMLSIWFTDPEFEGVSFSAFPAKDAAPDETAWEAQTERKRKQQQSNDTSQPQGGEAAPLDDAIPY